MYQDNDKLVRRLKIIEGQIRGLQQMLSQSKDVLEVLTQTAAAKQALSNIEDILFENYLSEKLAGHSSDEREHSIGEILKAYQLKSR